MFMYLAIVGAIVISCNGMADVVRSQIYSVERATNGIMPFIRLTNGRVVFLKSSDEYLSKGLNEYIGSVEIMTDENNDLLSIRSVQGDFSFKDIEMAVAQEIQSFEPSILKDVSEAEKVFKRFNHKYQRVSQCFNRAHIWAHDEFIKNNLRSHKAWLFFTASYINRNRFLWWFHVAPMFKVKDGDKTQDMVMDHRFSRRPQTINEWKDMFVYSKRSCKLGKFSEYDVNADQTQDCYWITTPMYYWLPADINNEELNNRYKTEFQSGDLRAARSEAF